MVYTKYPDILSILDGKDMQSADNLKQPFHTPGILVYIAHLQRSCQGTCTDVQTCSDDDEIHRIEETNEDTILTT